MISEVGRFIFWAGLTEAIFILIAISLKDNKKHMLVVIVFGTIISGIIGYFSQISIFTHASLESIANNLPVFVENKPKERQFQTISLRTWSELSSPETNLGMTPGTHEILDTPFDLGWKASTQCSHLPNQPTLFEFSISIPSPKSVHMLIQAGYGYNRYSGYQIGELILHFSDGSKSTTSFIMGVNIRDWAWENPAAVNTVTSPASRPAWQGYAPNGTFGGVDFLTVDVASEKSELTLKKLQISDSTMTTIGEINPCIHLVALTIEYLK